MQSGFSVFSIFQSTLPYGSDYRQSVAVCTWFGFQSTLPYGSDVRDRGDGLGRNISIHAPVWERRAEQAIPTVPVDISIHAPVWERHKVLGVPWERDDFNPRSRMGAPRSQFPNGRSLPISIHAPVWERLHQPWTAAPSTYFNPRSRMGATGVLLGGHRGLIDFNPRSRMGATMRHTHKIGGRHKFQSTLPYGSDLHLSADYYPIFDISIHAPVWERPGRHVRRPPHRISIHAPVWERRGISDIRCVPRNFNPRSRMGATTRLDIMGEPTLFQSTLPYGSDLQQHVTFDHPFKFQSTLPYGSDTIRWYNRLMLETFQSTLPYGSDCSGGHYIS